MALIKDRRIGFAMAPRQHSKSKSKSKKRADLFALMRKIPESETIFRIMVTLGDSYWTTDPDKDRSAAILGASFLEFALRKAISYHLKVDPSDPDFKYLFEGDEAPYRELASRLRLARALGVIDPELFAKLEAIRLIRNAFAHTMEQITFQTPEVAAYFYSLTGIVDSEAFNALISAFAPSYTLIEMPPGDIPNRAAFTQAVFIFCWKLMNYPPKTKRDLLIEGLLKTQD